MQPLVAQSVAQSGLSFLIYLVIGVIWVIGKMAENTKAKAKVEEMKSRREERERGGRPAGYPPVAAPQHTAPAQPRSLDTELQDFLGRLAGEPVRPAAPAPPPPRPRPVIAFDPPKPKYAPQPVAPPPIPVKVSAVMLSEEARAFKPMENIREAEEIMHKGGLSEQTSLLSVRTLMVDMSRSSLRIPIIGTASMRSISTATAKPNLRNKATLRKAVIANMLLEPPKALQ